MSYINDRITLEEVSKIVYCIDFLYPKFELKPNELTQLIKKIKELIKIIDSFSQKDGSYRSSSIFSPLEETRYALFSLNLLEDLIQDMRYYYDVKDFKPISKIYEHVKDIKKTYNFIIEAHSKNNY